MPPAGNARRSRASVRNSLLRQARGSLSQEKILILVEKRLSANGLEGDWNGSQFHVRLARVLSD